MNNERDKNLKINKSVSKKDDKVVKEPKKIEPKKKAITEVSAKARFIRISPRKVRLVIEALRGKSADGALDYLRFVRKAAVEPVTKLINSAIANAQNNVGLEKKDFYIKKIIANDGPVLKRWRPRAYGRSAPILKRTSHIELILGLKPGVKPTTVQKKTIVEQKGKEEKNQAVKIVTPGK